MTRPLEDPEPSPRLSAAGRHILRDEAEDQLDPCLFVLDGAMKTHGSCTKMITPGSWVIVQEAFFLVET